MRLSRKVGSGSCTAFAYINEGSLKRFRHSGTKWGESYQAPANSCDFYGVYGPFGLCRMSGSPKCKCFKGFVPKSSEEWKIGNWTDGCVRRTELYVPN
ncbi:hypothetical protein YC2023_051389 [Brassica napus]